MSDDLKTRNLFFVPSILGSVLIFVLAGPLAVTVAAKDNGPDPGCSRDAVRLVVSHVRCLFRADLRPAVRTRERARRRCMHRYAQASRAMSADVSGRCAEINTVVWTRAWRSVSRIRRSIGPLADLAFGHHDNGDGTITDRNSGLTWEKKDEAGGLHDVDRVLRIAGDIYTVDDWIDQVNAENGDGFAGHNDWRLPTATELRTLVDYGQIHPSVHAIYTQDCTTSCENDTCSCNSSGNYWTADRYAELWDDEPYAWTVGFYDGRVVPRILRHAQFARLVRDAD